MEDLQKNCEKFTKLELENIFGLFGLPFRKSKTKAQLCAELQEKLEIKQGVKRGRSMEPTRVKKTDKKARKETSGKTDKKATGGKMEKKETGAKRVPVHLQTVEAKTRLRKLKKKIQKLQAESVKSGKDRETLASLEALYRILLLLRVGDTIKVETIDEDDGFPIETSEETIVEIVPENKPKDTWQIKTNKGRYYRWAPRFGYPEAASMFIGTPEFFNKKLAFQKVVVLPKDVLAKREKEMRREELAKVIPVTDLVEHEILTFLNYFLQH